MRLGLFLAVAVVLAAPMIGLMGPVPGTFEARFGGALVPPPTATRCLTLAYELPGDVRWLPGTMRLTSVPAPVFETPGAAGFNAVGGPFPYKGYREAAWRPAGRDSIDIRWHHSPTLRLPVAPIAHGDTLVGRGGWSSYSNLYVAMVADGDFVVRARETPCRPQW